MFHRGRKKCFGNNQNILFMNEIELESLLSMVSTWLLGSSERKDYLQDKNLETTGWVVGFEAWKLHTGESKAKDSVKIKLQGY